MHMLVNNYPKFTVPTFGAIKKIKSPSEERAPFYPETTEIIDNVYKNYKNSLNEVSFHDIKTTALEVAQETQTPKKDVLKAMQALTQFANMKDLNLVSNAINKANIEFLGNENSELTFNAMDFKLSARNIVNVSSETGIHNSLTYLLDKKNLAPFKYANNGHIGLILDDEKIAQLEQVKKTQPKEFEKFVNDKSLKFFYISGWDNGISIIDRTKDLKKETVKLLNTAKEHNLPPEKAIDYSSLDRINKLGIRPTVIKNEKEANELTIYNQMRPEQIRTKDSLYNIIEANTLNRFFGCSDTEKAVSNHVTAKYLEDTLSVYTFEKMSQDLKTLNEKIEQYAKDRNRTPIYVLPNKNIKSSDLINYSYKKINNIDSSNFIYMSQLPSFFRYNKEERKDSLLVLIDDCALSGNSMLNILSYNTDFKNVNSEIPILFANLKCSDEALNNFVNSSNHPVDIMYLDKIKSHHVSDGKLEDVIGKPQYRENAYSLVFPYMAPDNNSELATNVALLHNSKYLSQNFSSMFNRNYYRNLELENLSDIDRNLYKKKSRERMMNYSNCTKNLSPEALETSSIYAKTIGLSPQTLEHTETGLSPKEVEIVTNEYFTDPNHQS